MKYLICADFHGNIDAYGKMERVANKIVPDKIILLGDLFDYAGAIAVNMALKNIYIPILAVNGNCDYPTDFRELNAGLRVTGFSEKIENRMVYFTHGHLYGRNTLPDGMTKGDIIFYGHYHVPEIVKKEGVWRICVGSAGRPSIWSEASYCVFDGKSAEIFSLDTGKSIVKQEF